MKPASLLALLLSALPLCAQQDAPDTVPAPTRGTWTASWATSIQGPEQSQPATPATPLADATLRQIVHLSAGGRAVRVQLSNAFGTSPLVVDAAAIAQAKAPGTPDTLPGSDRPLTFAGKASVTLPIGATFISDPVSLEVAPLSTLAISLHFPAAPAGESAHPGSRATSFLLAGNHVQEIQFPGAAKLIRWLQLAEVDVAVATPYTVVALGDSITDGHGATTDGNDRWPDVFAAHLQASGLTHIAVVNEGIGGNHLLTNGIGQSVLQRFDRDVLGVAGVRSVILLEGINDLGALSRAGNGTAAQHADLVQRIEVAYVQILERAHAHGLKVYGATITPDTGSDYYHPTATDDADRQAVNAWIRQLGHFDDVVDFDKLVRDPAHPTQLLPAYDSGDHLHPGPAGYKAMGDAIPLRWFR